MIWLELNLRASIIKKKYQQKNSNVLMVRKSLKKNVFEF